MVKQHRNNLFNDCELSIILENVYNSIIPQVESIPKEIFFSASETELVEKLVAQNSIKQITLREDKITMSKPALCKLTPAGKIYRPVSGQDPPDLNDGMTTQVKIPFTGDKRLLVSRPSMHYAHGGPSFTIKEDRIIKDYVSPLYSDPKSFKRHFQRNYETISKYLEWQAHDINLFAQRMRRLVISAVAIRKKRGKTIPLHLVSNPGANNFASGHVNCNHANFRRQNVNPEMPVISDEDFTKAIQVLRHTGNSFERTPTILDVHNDHDLRNILVSNLNTHFSGNNGKDMFNHVGENGFEVSIANRPAIIGRCFTWRCAEGLTYTINTLIQDTLCQSCKIILTIFNRTEKNFNVLLELIRETFLQHPCMVRIENEFAKNEWHTTINTFNDIEDYHWVHLMVFNLYTTTKKNEDIHLTEEERNFFAK
ncbi:hypothetical protein [Maridesulfovibrio sp.]|uniref:hypothetical protein n=1 Tax=Maridesulfovibrio sp. TaxID=2795000 RepID=UPI0039EEB8A4